MISRLKERTARVGLFGVGFDTYWSQFTELQESRGLVGSEQ
jgi:hypothetical protein